MPVPVRGQKPSGAIGQNVAPAERFWTTVRHGAVKLRMEETGPASEPPVTTHQRLWDSAQRFGNHPALAIKRDGQWQTTTYRQYYQACRAAAKSFLKLGLERFHGVGILGSNSPEWFIGHLGAIIAGGIPAGIYTTSSADACQYVASNSEANILLVEDDDQLKKILQVQEQLPHLKAIVQYNDDLKEKRPNVYTWAEFMQLGSEVPDSELDDVIASQRVNQCSTLVYTSGTTGPPKGVMLSHDGITWLANMFSTYSGLREREIHVSFLPLSHLAAQFFDIWLPMCLGGTTCFANKDALKSQDSLFDTLKEVRPTVFFGVPRTWEKFQGVLVDVESKSSSMQRSISTSTREPSQATNLNHVNSNGSGVLGYSMADLGLDRCVLRYTGGAITSKETLEYFMGLNLPIIQVYGMSESSGNHTVSLTSNYRMTSCGKTVPGCKTRIHMPDEDGNGEICIGGRNVFMGYLNMVEKTKNALDEEGWLHTGDIGKLDQDGFLYLTGRIKELVITSGGKNFPPIPIESDLKKEVPIISYAILVGDKRRFLSMLITLKCTIDPKTLMPGDDLTPEAIRFCQQLGSRATRVSQVVRSKDPAIYKAIQEGLDRVNKKAESHAHRVQKWAILEKDFSVEGGELGPTMKMKRPVILKKYEKIIDALYKVGSSLQGETQRPLAERNEEIKSKL
ncbi:long-chain-fatty-acid--CoA ligase ACSBG2-like [Lissotriton helveticus]